MGSVNPGDQDQVKGGAFFSIFYKQLGEFYGGLNTITTSTMYRWKSNESGVISLRGTPVDVSTFTYEMKGGWNHLPCPYSTTVTVVTAGEFCASGCNVPDVQYSAQDLLKDRENFATYYEGLGWYNGASSFFLAPGKGYMLKWGGITTSTVKFDTPSGRRQLSGATDPKMDAENAKKIIDAKKAVEA